MGEERELLMALALNRSKMASQREIAVAYWGLEEVGKHWDTADWMHARVRYRLDKTREIERKRGDGDRHIAAGRQCPGDETRRATVADAGCREVGGILGTWQAVS